MRVADVLNVMEGAREGNGEWWWGCQPTTDKRVAWRSVSTNLQALIQVRPGSICEIRDSLRSFIKTQYCLGSEAIEALF